MAWSRQRLPYPQMSPGARDRASRILANTSQYRRMPSLQYPVDPNMYQYLINHPDVAVSTWRAMGISKLQMSQRVASSTKRGRSTAPTASPMCCGGTATSACSLWKAGITARCCPSSINASALVWLQYRFVRNSQGEVVSISRSKPSSTSTARRLKPLPAWRRASPTPSSTATWFEVSLYARMMSQAGQRDPQWISEVASRLDGVPASRRVELVRVSRGLKPYGVNAVVRQQPSDSAAVLHIVAAVSRLFSIDAARPAACAHRARAPPARGSAMAAAAPAKTAPADNVTAEHAAANSAADASSSAGMARLGTATLRTVPAAAGATTPAMTVSQSQAATDEEVATPFLKESEYAEPLIPPAAEDSPPTAGAAAAKSESTLIRAAAEQSGDPLVQPADAQQAAASPATTAAPEQPAESAKEDAATADASAESGDAGLILSAAGGDRRPESQSQVPVRAPIQVPTGPATNARPGLLTPAEPVGSGAPGPMFRQASEVAGRGKLASWSGAPVE